MDESIFCKNFTENMKLSHFLSYFNNFNKVFVSRFSSKSFNIDITYHVLKQLIAFRNIKFSVLCCKLVCIMFGFLIFVFKMWR